MKNETWKERWQKSFDKWNKAVELTSRLITFSNKRGFSNIEIVGFCGYCEEFLNGWDCKRCYLFQRHLCRRRPDVNIFWEYVHEMQKGIDNPSAVNWTRALALATKMRDSIEKDRPN